MAYHDGNNILPPQIIQLQRHPRTQDENDEIYVRMFRFCEQFDIILIEELTQLGRFDISLNQNPLFERLCDSISNLCSFMEENNENYEQLEGLTIEFVSSLRLFFYPNTDFNEICED